MVSVLMPDRGLPSDHQKVHIESILITLNTNMSACHLQLGNFDRAIICANAALEIDPNSVKALYRRALARLKQSPPQLNKVLEDLIAAQQGLLPARDAGIDALTKDVATRVKALDERQEAQLRVAFSKMFD